MFVSEVSFLKIEYNPSVYIFQFGLHSHKSGLWTQTLLGYDTHIIVLPIQKSKLTHFCLSVKAFKENFSKNFSLTILQEKLRTFSLF